MTRKEGYSSGSALGARSSRGAVTVWGKKKVAGDEKKQVAYTILGTYTVLGH